MSPYTVSARELDDDSRPVRAPGAKPPGWTTLPFWFGLLAVAGAVAMFLWSREYAGTLPSRDDDGYVEADGTLFAGYLALLLLWQLGIALLTWGWQLRYGASSLLWGASTALSLSVFGLYASTVFWAWGEFAFPIIGFLLLHASLLGLAAGVVCVIALFVQRRLS